VHDPNATFRLDRRLQQRRGWIASEQLEKELSALPDVSEKAELVDSPQHKGSEAPPLEGDGE
jgi:hypothetical protein